MKDWASYQLEFLVGLNISIDSSDINHNEDFLFILLELNIIVLYQKEKKRKK